MRKLIYSMSVSLDGFIAGPGGEIDWSVPDDELFRFHTEQVRELGGHLPPLVGTAILREVWVMRLSAGRSSRSRAPVADWMSGCCSPRRGSLGPCFGFWREGRPAPEPGER
jgi:hypothetical protein